ncbi:hypothetical protein NECAME_11766 [Necator americanus]|uniref:Uncharacterized protein n=1 Tax=Necator americanus TaxID=51031 RepID=W2T329_NECAM|nr:hypothetical protein NECAME_11766 [Necator americanus]ETN76288.1 hypothetical protein NECAME_11766 [Necator americanus]
MVPSPRKTRTSPRKKAWASPVKKSVTSISSIFNEAEFSPLNSSWAEITANDESLNGSIMQSLSKSEARRNRKAAVPKKVNSKPKFVRSLELTEEIMTSSRRSERVKDKMKSWKRSLYDWAGEEPSDSVNTSFCSHSSDEIKKEEEQENRCQSVLRSVREIEEIQVRPETDAMASLLGHFDMDSRRGDESTLKAPTNTLMSGGPVDFSSLKS